MGENNFKFKINNESWIIREFSQKEIKDRMGERAKFGYRDISEDAGRFYGVTLCDDMEILLDKDLPYERKKKTLIHELIHCYVATNITHEEKTYDEEMVADIVANSFYIIEDVITRYFQSNIKVNIDNDMINKIFKNDNQYKENVN